jgi:hypothetical protein
MPDGTEGISEWLDYHQSILEYSLQGLKISTLFPRDQLRAPEQGNFSYPMSTANVHMVFRTIVRCIGNEGAVNQVKSDNYVFQDHEDDVQVTKKLDKAQKLPKYRYRLFHTLVKK